MSAAADEVWQVGYRCVGLDTETSAEVIPKCDAEFGCCVHQAEEGVATVAPGVAVGATADLALDDLAANVAFGSVGVERYVRPLEDGEQFGLIGVQPRQQAIECGEAGAAAKDAIEAGTHLAAALCGWRRAIGLEVGIKPPDQRAYALLCVAVQIGEGVELVHNRSAWIQHSACRPTAN